MGQIIMEVTIPQSTLSYGNPLQFTKIGKLTYPARVWINRDSSNCKLSYIHGIGALGILTKEELKQVVNRCLQDCKGAVYINSTNKQVISYLKELYPTYSYTEVPIGYNTGFQYHILIKNTVKVNDNCRNPTAPVAAAPQIPASAISHNYVRTKLTELLKKKRRKTDIVEEFIKML